MIDTTYTAPLVKLSERLVESRTRFLGAVKYFELDTERIERVCDRFGSLVREKLAPLYEAGALSDEQVKTIGKLARAATFVPIRIPMTRTEAELIEDFTSFMVALHELGMWFLFGSLNGRLDLGELRDLFDASGAITMASIDELGSVCETKDVAERLYHRATQAKREALCGLN